MRRIAQAAFVAAVLCCFGSSSATACERTPAHEKLVRTLEPEFGQNIRALFDGLCADRSVLNPPSDIRTWGELEVFLSRPENIARARAMYLKNGEVFRWASEEYRIAPEHLIAVAMTETLGGEHLGAYPVLATLYNRYMYAKRSLALEDIRHFLEARPWEACECGSADSLPGSSAGAFGVVQFMPGSYRRYAVDGDGDGRTDLFSVADAIPSAANFLKRHGWHRNRAKALEAYNHSARYGEIILRLAELYAPCLSPFGCTALRP